MVKLHSYKNKLLANTLEAELGKKTGLEIPREKIADFCKKNHISKLSLFGSALRGELGPDSDIDFLIEFEQEHVPGFFDLARMERELSEILGEKVDLRTPQELSRYFRDEVVASARVEYAKG